MRSHYTVFLCLVVACAFVPACCPRNPLMNTAISAHGNTDWHIDTANEFLFGTDMGGTTTAANHCPNTWTRRHMHIGLTNTNHFYYDKDVATPGDDTDSTSGIDQAMLFFYAGHGSPTLWNTLGNNATQSDMRIGDCQDDNKGILRYYWQCSCEVFAHGPKTCAGATFVYACPGDFDGSADSVNMRNVYERWGPALAPQLRMACGASTDAYCHESEANRIWDNYNNKGMDVADSLIDGLNVGGVVPLCIAMGGSDVTATPLYDASFTNQPNTSGTTHYHIQYLSYFDSTMRPLEVLPLLDMLPIYRLEPKPVPSSMSAVQLKGNAGVMTIGSGDRQEKFEVRINPASGAIYVQGERKKTIVEKALEEKAYLEKAKSILAQLGVSEKEVRDPEGRRFMLQSMSVKDGRERGKGHQKNVLVTFRRYVETEGRKIPVLGDGGLISVQLNNDGSLQNVTKVWRNIVGIKTMARVLSYDEALKEATAKLNEVDRYRLDWWNWGYKEADGNVSQKDLRIVFQFAFVPKEQERVLEYPPRLVEVMGQKE